MDVVSPQTAGRHVHGAALYTEDVDALWTLRWTRAHRCCTRCRTSSGAIAMDSSPTHSGIAGALPHTCATSCPRRSPASPRSCSAARPNSPTRSVTVSTPVLALGDDPGSVPVRSDGDAWRSRSPGRCWCPAYLAERRCDAGLGPRRDAGGLGGDTPALVRAQLDPCSGARRPSPCFLPRSWRCGSTAHRPPRPSSSPNWFQHRPIPGDETMFQLSP